MPYFDSVAPFVFGVSVLTALGLGFGLSLGRLSNIDAPCQANLVIIRHGEKPVENWPNLSKTGVARSQYLGRCANLTAGQTTQAFWMGAPDKVSGLCKGY
jgi:hypothetical protein